ncbi:hypothetical protein [Nitrosopumilus ureiphilus]|uniref:Uncharacterized protein n=1 Tax=Nitrosopumilus ureiphilus TaxID=1470067 RepID=A0A7D5RE06_9ARCH|nr:hypothetical protein [Nitrosopumilus ureiphilus]QLH07101.1 hypothetical protein C5F50_08470 [Nitrosopumilus ureiphilus]
MWLKTEPELSSMAEDKILFSTIIKKTKRKSEYPVTITIPKTVIQASNSMSDFFKVYAYSDRIEIRPHQFKCVIKKREDAKNHRTVKQNDMPAEHSIKSTDAHIEETKHSENDNTEEITNKLDDAINQLEK